MHITSSGIPCTDPIPASFPGRAGQRYIVVHEVKDNLEAKYVFDGATCQVCLLESLPPSIKHYFQSPHPPRTLQLGFDSRWITRARAKLQTELQKEPQWKLVHWDTKVVSLVPLDIGKKGAMRHIIPWIEFDLWANRLSRGGEWINWRHSGDRWRAKISFPKSTGLDLVGDHVQIYALLQGPGLDGTQHIELPIENEGAEGNNFVKFEVDDSVHTEIQLVAGDMVILTSTAELK